MGQNKYISSSSRALDLEIMLLALNEALVCFFLCRLHTPIFVKPQILQTTHQIFLRQLENDVHGCMSKSFILELTFIFIGSHKAFNVRGRQFIKIYSLDISTHFTNKQNLI